MKTRGSQGFHIVEMLVIVVIVGLIAFIGYRVFVTTTTKPNNNAAQTTATPTTIKSKTDIQSASKQLDASAPDNSLDPAQLDADLQSIL